VLGKKHSFFFPPFRFPISVPGYFFGKTQNHWSSFPNWGVPRPLSFSAKPTCTVGRPCSRPPRGGGRFIRKPTSVSENRAFQRTVFRLFCRECSWPLGRSARNRATKIECTRKPARGARGPQQSMNPVGSIVRTGKFFHNPQPALGIFWEFCPPEFFSQSRWPGPGRVVSGKPASPRRGLIYTQNVPGVPCLVPQHWKRSCRPAISPSRPFSLVGGPLVNRTVEVLHTFCACWMVCRPSLF